MNFFSLIKISKGSILTDGDDCGYVCHGFSFVISCFIFLNIQTDCPLLALAVRLRAAFPLHKPRRFLISLVIYMT